MSDERLDLIDAIVYADGFDCPATATEVWRYCRRPLLPAELARRLDDPDLRSLVSRRDGLLCLAGRESLLTTAPVRRERALRLQRRARRVARVLRHLPFVRGLELTGSAAAGDAASGADVDLLVVVAPRRLATVFFVLGSLSRLTRRRLFCPNHYLAQDHTKLANRDLYVAREIAQAIPLAGSSLAGVNDWVADLLPNAATRPAPPARPSRLQRALERALCGPIGEALERRLHGVALARLGAHHGTTPPAWAVAQFKAGVELRFHRDPVHERALARYHARREQLGTQLREQARV